MASDHETESKEKSCFQGGINSLSLSSSSKHQKNWFVGQVLIRVLAIVFTVAAISVMVTSNQTVVVYGISFVARYSYTSAFKFLLGVDVVVCAFSVLSLIYVSILCRSGSSHDPMNYFFLFLHDFVMTVLMMSGSAAGTAIGYVSRYGEEKIGWVSVCNNNNVDHFCNQVLASVVLSYLVFFVYFLLTTISAHKLIIIN